MFTYERLRIFSNTIYLILLLFNLFVDKWFRITLRFHFSNVIIAARIYPPLKQNPPLLSSQNNLSNGGSIAVRHYTNRNNHIFILIALPNIQTIKREKVEYLLNFSSFSERPYI